MADAKTKSVRIGGLWLKEVGAEGSKKTLWAGNFEQATIKNALAEVASDGRDVQITIWVNKDEDKFNPNSPDGSLVVSEKWQKREEGNGGGPARTTSDEIPF
jgi:hypothetical protein